MHGARMDATATLLQDGKVLIAGGSPDQVLTQPVLASAELYDPTTGEFTPTGSMATARTDATATLLPDGRVLIAGGWGCPNRRMCSPDDTASGGGALASAELYDPATGKFSRTGSMSEPRQGAAATLLPDGRVVMTAGGSQVVEVYDPATGKFSRAGSLLNFYVDLSVRSLPSPLLRLEELGRIDDVSVVTARDQDSAVGQSGHGLAIRSRCHLRVEQVEASGWVINAG
jgi:hypothetical protein